MKSSNTHENSTTMSAINNNDMSIAEQHSSTKNATTTANQSLEHIVHDSLTEIAKNEQVLKLPPPTTSSSTSSTTLPQTSHTNNGWTGGGGLSSSSRGVSSNGGDYCKVMAMAISHPSSSTPSEQSATLSTSSLAAIVSNKGDNSSSTDEMEGPPSQNEEGGQHSPRQQQQNASNSTLFSFSTAARNGDLHNDQRTVRSGHTIVVAEEVEAVPLALPSLLDQPTPTDFPSSVFHQNNHHTAEKNSTSTLSTTSFSSDQQQQQPPRLRHHDLKELSSSLVVPIGTKMKKLSMKTPTTSPTPPNSNNNNNATFETMTSLSTTNNSNKPAVSSHHNNMDTEANSSSSSSGDDKPPSENGGSDGGYAASASSNASGTCSSPSVSSSEEQPTSSKATHSHHYGDSTSSSKHHHHHHRLSNKRKAAAQRRRSRDETGKRIRKSGSGSLSFSSDLADFSSGSRSYLSGSSSPRISSCSNSSNEEEMQSSESDGNSSGGDGGGGDKPRASLNGDDVGNDNNDISKPQDVPTVPEGRWSSISSSKGTKTTGLDKEDSNTSHDNNNNNTIKVPSFTKPKAKTSSPPMKENGTTQPPRSLSFYENYSELKQPSMKNSSSRRRRSPTTSLWESLQERQHNDLKATFQSALKQLDSTSTVSSVAYAKLSSLDSNSSSDNEVRKLPPIRISLPDLTNVESAPIYDVGVDMMACIMSYLDPIEVHSFLIMPLSKTWRMRFTVPQDLWKVLCLSDPFYAKLDATQGGNSSDDSASTYPICDELKIKHILGRYRLLYSSFIRCFTYLNRIKKRAESGKSPIGSDDEQPVADRPFKGNSSLKNFYKNVKKVKYGHSKLTQKLLGPSAGVAGDTELPYSCAIYSVVNWMVAFTDVAGIQTSCCKVLPCLLEDENQRTIAQHAGLTDIVLRAMVLFPDISALHTAAFHTLVLLARPLGGKEGEIFHTSMVNSSAIFNSGSSTGRSGIAVMLDSMKRFSQDENLQAMGCWSMVNIALIPSQKVVLVKLGGISVATNSMMQHPYNAEVQFRALFALINLVIPSANLPEQSNESIREQVGGVNDSSEREMLDESIGQITSLVLVSMKNFWQSEAILNRACLVLHNLSLNEQYHNVLLFTPNCYEMLEWCIGNYKNDGVLQQSASGTLRRLQVTLSEDDDLRRRFAQSKRTQQQQQQQTSTQTS